ncbi:MAG: energy transducer TonB [Treponema sp.]|nr:energy transducer TonB [Treponema sp.]MCL2252056.1 energy transducer TonB [Treponema sp.]
MNEKFLRLLILIFTAALHLVIIFFLAFNTETVIQEIPQDARVMKLIDMAELPPPPPSSFDEDIPQVEEIAETMIETDYVPVQNVVAAGTLNVVEAQENYLPMHLVTTPPVFDEASLVADLIYPPIALRSGVEGRVFLDLFVDRTGTVQRITILREDPEGRGFGEAAVRMFTGKKGSPAIANGEPVSCRYRYPVVFRINR